MIFLLVRSNVVLHTIFFFSSRRRHTRFKCDWSSDVCSSDLSTEFFIRSRHEEFRGLRRFHIQTVDAAAIEVSRPNDLVLIVNGNGVGRWKRWGVGLVAGDERILRDRAFAVVEQADPARPVEARP